MRKILLFLFPIVFLCGCVAIVDNRGEEKQVKSFIVPEKEVLVILDQAEEKNPGEIRELFRIEKSASR